MFCDFAAATQLARPFFTYVPVRSSPKMTLTCHLEKNYLPVSQQHRMWPGGSCYLWATSDSSLRQVNGSEIMEAYSCLLEKGQWSKRGLLCGPPSATLLPLLQPAGPSVSCSLISFRILQPPQQTKSARLHHHSNRKSESLQGGWCLESR